jgi:hypothetical protein
MTQVPISLGRTEIQLTARGKAGKIPPALQEVPGGLYPLMSAAFEVDEYRILSGWPMPVPDYDIRIECLVSGDGDVLGNRDSPTALLTDADMRWVADSDFYDEVGLQWNPIQGGVSPWRTTVENAPTLISDYEYTIGDERFVEMTVLNFDSDTANYMWNDLTGFIGGTFGYTVIMVMSPNSMYGNNATLTNNALWSPDDTVITGFEDDGKPILDGSAWTMFTMQDQMLWMTTEEKAQQKGVAIGNGLSSTAPIFLAIVVSRPQTTLYAASGASKVDVKALAAGEAPEPLNTSFWLGSGPFGNSATMDMALLDLGIYGNPLTADQVVAEISALSGVYGGDK